MHRYFAALVTLSSLLCLNFLSLALADSWPTQNLTTTINSGFGPRKHPNTGLQSFHNGIDLNAPDGELFTAEAGDISYKQFENWYGHMLGSANWRFCHINWTKQDGQGNILWDMTLPSSSKKYYDSRILVDASAPAITVFQFKPVNGDMIVFSPNIDYPAAPGADLNVYDGKGQIVTTVNHSKTFTEHEAFTYEGNSAGVDKDGNPIILPIHLHLMRTTSDTSYLNGKSPVQSLGSVSTTPSVSFFKTEKGGNIWFNIVTDPPILESVAVSSDGQTETAKFTGLQYRSYNDSFAFAQNKTSWVQLEAENGSVSHHRIVVKDPALGSKAAKAHLITVTATTATGTSTSGSFCIRGNGSFDPTGEACKKDKACDDPVVAQGYYVAALSPQLYAMNPATPTDSCKIPCPEGENCDDDPGPGGDHPDDNYDVFTFDGSEYDLNSYTDAVNYRLRVLATGYYDEARYILNKGKDWNKYVIAQEVSASTMNEADLIIVPSGGLGKFGGSSNFRTGLSEYVRAGGTLLVFGQQYGSAFEALPGGEVKGYGWAEDQSCFSASSYIDTWHPLLAGQTASKPSLNVDGYFTSWPSTSTVVLRRNANGQPDLIVYPYGNGKVIATTIYSDWAFAHGQASKDEVALVRDMVAWAQNTAADTPEIQPGGSVTAAIPVVNNSGVAATPVLTLLSPDSKTGIAQVVGSPLAPGAQSQLSITYTASANATVGIYTPAYHLVDANGNPVQAREATDAGRVAVATRPAVGVGGSGLNFAIQSNGERFLQGSNVDFTFNLWNNGDTARNIKVTWGLPHHGFGWDSYFNKTITIPAKSSTNFVYTLQGVKDLDRLRAKFYDETGQQVGYAEKGIWMLQSNLSASLQLDKPLYKKGDNVAAAVMAKNLGDLAISGMVSIKLFDPANLLVAVQSYPISLLSQASSVNTVNLVLPANTAIGTYRVGLAVADSSGKQLAMASAPLEVVTSKLAVATLTPVVNGAIVGLPFEFTNVGYDPSMSGTVTFDLRDPAGASVWTDTQPLAPVLPGQKGNLTVNLPVAKQFGQYHLDYVMNYDGKTERGTLRLPSAATVNLQYDKTAYKVREQAAFSITAANVGAFRQDLQITVNIPDVGYSHTQSIGLNPGGNIILPQTMVQLPSNIGAGQHFAHVTLALPSGTQRIANAFVVSESSLAVDLGGNGATTFNGGDSIALTVENTGGTDTSFAVEKLLLLDSMGKILYQESSSSGAILSGEKKDLTQIPVPFQAASGKAYINAWVRDIATGKVASFYKTLHLNSVNLGMSAQTDQAIYSAGQGVTSLATLANGPNGLTGASLKLSIFQPRELAPEGFKHFLPINGFPFNQPIATALGPDGSLYVLDGNARMIYKFDATGNYTTQWGGSGYRDGKFNYPTDIEVGPDGSVYVADPLHYRIQKFDSSGNFIATWGSYGSGAGQFGWSSRGWVNMAISADGAIYATDPGNHRLQKFDPNGNYLGGWGSYGWGSGQFAWPTGVAVGKDGSVYIADTYNNRIQKFDANGLFSTAWGGYGYSGAQLAYPTYIAAGPDGTIYVIRSGYNYSYVLKFDSNGNFIGQWGGIDSSNDGQFKYPSGITVTPDNTVIVADSGNQRIQQFTAFGTFISLKGSISSGDGFFNYPSGVATGPDGSIYVADTWNYRIQKFNQNGDFVTKWGSYCHTDTNWDGKPDQPCTGQFDGPESIAVTADGSVFVLDTYNHRVQKFDGNGNYISQWGSRGNQDGQLYYPFGMASGPDGSIYVMDTYNQRVQKFDGSGNFVTKWGSMGSGYGQFSYPWGIGVDPLGNVYVADSYNNRVQKFDGLGNFIKAWGRADYYGNGNGGFSFDMAGISIGPDGMVYVVDGTWYNPNVQQFDMNGKFIKQWAGWGSGDGGFSDPKGITVASDGTVYVADAKNHRIQRMMTGSATGGATLWQTTLPVTQAANATSNLSELVGTLNATGKLYLQASLTNSLGQELAKSEYPFYILQGSTAILFDTDKKLYKPGESVTISGQVKNLAGPDLANLTLSLAAKTKSGTSQTLLTQTLAVASGGAYPFTATAVAGAEGPVSITGTLTQNGTALATLVDNYEVAKPVVTASVTAPSLVNRDPFQLNIELKNASKIDASVQAAVGDGSWSDLQTFDLPAGETKLLQYSRSILRNAAYTINLTGDVSQTLTKQVLFGEGASASMAAQPVYAEGTVEIPVTLTGTGQLESTVNARYTLLNSAGATVQDTMKTRLLPAASGLQPAVTDTLSFQLPEGNYTLAYSSEFWSGAIQFQVKKAEKIAVAVTPGVQANDQIPLSVTVTNDGLNPYSGTVEVLVGNWKGMVEVANLPVGQSQSFNLVVPVAILGPGNHTVSVLGLTSGGISVGSLTVPIAIAVAAPEFVITQTPASPVITAGQPGALTFRVKNTGTASGEATLTLKLADTMDEVQTIPLAPSEERAVDLPVLMPDDLEEKNYDAGYILSHGENEIARGQVRFFLQGVKVTVSAGLDKPYYKAGDTARLTLNVTGPVLNNLYARVNYGSYETTQPLSGGSMTFDVPITQFNGQKLFYGVYHNSGRSIHLNALYLYPEEAITMVTGKQVYLPGETVTFTASGPATPGTLTVSAPGYSQALNFSGTAAGSFTLPSVVKSGTYYLNAKLETQNSQPGLPSPVSGLLSSNHPFDVKGTEVKILETTLDRNLYNAKDTISGTLVINSNQNIPATLKVWSVSSDGEYTLIGKETVQLSPVQNTVHGNQWKFETSSAGTHSIIFRLYGVDGQGEPIFLSSTSKAFDVGSGTLLAVRTGKESYPTASDPVTVKVDLNGTGYGTVAFYVDGLPAGSQPVTLNGFTQISYPLSGPLTPGPHQLKAVYTAGGLTSSKFSSFDYGTHLPDLEVRIYPAGMAYPNYRIGVTVANNGKMASQPTSVPVYDGDPAAGGLLIGTVQVPALKPFETMNFTLDWNIAGKMGTSHRLAGYVNGDGTVLELSSANNGATVNFTLPVDNAPPTITAGAPVDWISAAAPTLTATLWDDPEGVGVDPASIQLTVDNSASVAATYNPATGILSGLSYPLSEGLHQVSLRAKDLVGNPAAASWSFRVDTTPPSVMVGAPAADRYLNINSPAITAVVSDNPGSGIDPASLLLTLNGQPVQALYSPATGQLTASTQALAEGTHRVSLSAKDNVGNPATLAWSFSVDTIPPALTAGLPAADRYTGSRTPDVTATALDNPGSGIDPASILLSVDGTALTASYSAVSGELLGIPATLTDGSHQAMISAKDIAGNAATIHWSFLVDATPPVISGQSPAEGAVLKTVLPNIAAQMTDTGAGIDLSSALVTLDGFTISRFDASTGSFRFGVSQPLSREAHTVLLSVSDLVGNTASSTWSFTVDAVPLAVTSTMDHRPRVLAWVRTPDPSTDNNVKLVTEALGTMDLIYTLVHTKEAFRKSLKSNKYNAYLVLTSPGAAPIEADMADIELAEQVNGGKGLILSFWSEPDRREKEEKEERKGFAKLYELFDLFGVEFKKVEKDKTRILYYGSKLENALTVAGPVFKIEIEEEEKDGFSSAQVIGSFESEKKEAKEAAAIVYHPYGKGKTVLFTFDLGQAPSGPVETQIMASLLRDAIVYASPAKETLLPGMEVPFILNTASTEVPMTSRFELTLPPGATVTSNPDGAVLNGNILTWSLNLAAREKRTLRYTLQINSPFEGGLGVVPVNTGVWFLTFNDSYHQQEVLPLSVSVAEGIQPRMHRISYNLHLLREPVIREHLTADQVYYNLTRLLDSPLDPKKDILKNLELAGLKRDLFEKDYDHRDSIQLELLNAIRWDLDYVMEMKEMGQ